MKMCPFCAEEIQDAAIVCKHCGRDLKKGAPLSKGDQREGGGTRRRATRTSA